MAKTQMGTIPEDYDVHFGAELRDKISHVNAQGMLSLKPEIAQCVVAKLGADIGAEHVLDPSGFGDSFLFYRTEEEGLEEGEEKVEVYVWVHSDEFIAELGHKDPPGLVQAPEVEFADRIVKYLKECADAQESKAGGRRKSRKSKKTRKTTKAKKTTRRR